MPRRVLALLAVALVAGGILAAPPAASADEHETPVLRVVVTGLRWDDVSTLATPALWDVSRRADVGLVAARSANGVACPADGWLAV